jgi:hypothetical protein
VSSGFSDAARRYKTAFADRRRVGSLSDDIGFDEALRHARDWIGITQQPEEARRLWTLVRALEPRSVVEIGLDAGGTFFLWTRAAASDALLIAIDTRPPGKLGRWSPFELSRRAFARDDQRVRLLLGRDSHSEETVGTVRAILADDGLDFLSSTATTRTRASEPTSSSTPLSYDRGASWPCMTSGRRADPKARARRTTAWSTSGVSSPQSSKSRSSSIGPPDGFGIGVVHVPE